MRLIDSFEILIPKEMTMIIQSTIVIAMYFLQKRLQLCGFFGVIVIKHNSSLKKSIQFGALLRIAVFPLSNSIHRSSLPVFVWTIAWRLKKLATWIVRQKSF